MSGHGKIIFKYGTMSSGKSLQLIATAHNFQEHSIPFLILKSEIDTRDGENVIHSRALGDRECVSISQKDNLYVLVAEYLTTTFMFTSGPLKWILVDEAQFLTAKQVDELAAIADIYGINVICYGLRTDFRTMLFEGSKRLFEIADSVDEIKSTCFCNSKTIFNARMDENGNIITDGAQVEIGGDERYTSFCRKCYMEKTKNSLYIHSEKF